MFLFRHIDKLTSLSNDLLDFNDLTSRPQGTAGNFGSSQITDSWQKKVAKLSPSTPTFDEIKILMLDAYNCRDKSVHRQIHTPNLWPLNHNNSLKMGWMMTMGITHQHACDIPKLVKQTGVEMALIDAYHPQLLL
jgi:hypothetical protein